jgi:hypothetical protein
MLLKGIQWKGIRVWRELRRRRREIGDQKGGHGCIYLVNILIVKF